MRHICTGVHIFPCRLQCNSEISSGIRKSSRFSKFRRITFKWLVSFIITSFVFHQDDKNLSQMLFCLHETSKICQLWAWIGSEIFLHNSEVFRMFSPDYKWPFWITEIFQNIWFEVFGVTIRTQGLKQNYSDGNGYHKSTWCRENEIRSCL